MEAGLDADGKPGIELAPLPRERVGPFLILGVPKEASAATIEARWAQCVLWARQGKTRSPLGDVHWAREVLRDPEHRLDADAASLNTDVAGSELSRLAAVFHLESRTPGWTPLDPDLPPLRSADIPEVAEIRSSVPAPEVPVELPGVGRWLADFAHAALDPWSIPLPPKVSPRGSDHE